MLTEPHPIRSGVIPKLSSLAGILLILGVSFLPVCSPRSRPNVLWITMDSLRSDHLGCYGYGPARTPNIDQLAAQSVLFADCISQASYTRISVPSMITGKYPFFLGMRTFHGDLDTAHVTVAEALAEEGYFTCAIAEPWPSGFFQGLEMLDVRDRRTPQKTRQCLQVLDDLDPRPFFIWLYYWDPHAPYSPPEAYRSAQEGTTPGAPDSFGAGPQSRPTSALGDNNLLLLLQLNRGGLVLSDAQKDDLVRLYDGEISFVDEGIGQVTEKLKQNGLWENTMVILSADHGEAFGEHGLFYHSHTLYDEEIRVPCVMKPPHFSEGGKIVSGPVRNLDLLPTILDFCGVSPPADIQGQSLRPYIEADQGPHLATCLETHSAHLQGHLMAYRSENHKLIYNLSSGSAELYDLKTDPGEGRSLLAEQAIPSGSPPSGLERELRDEMLSALGVREISALEVTDVPEMDPDTRDQLKALGYIY